MPEAGCVWTYAGGRQCRHSVTERVRLTRDAAHCCYCYAYRGQIVVHGTTERDFCSYHADRARISGWLVPSGEGGD